MPRNSYYDLKIMGQKARKSNSNRSCVQVLSGIFSSKYPGIYFQTSLGHRSSMGLSRHKSLLHLRVRCSCHCQGLLTETCCKFQKSRMAAGWPLTPSLFQHQHVTLYYSFVGQNPIHKTNLMSDTQNVNQALSDRPIVVRL